MAAVDGIPTAQAGSGGYRAETLGQRLREERLKRGVSVRGLAREVGVSASMISQIETAKSQPSVSTLYAITTALGVTVEELFTPTGGGGGGVGPGPDAAGGAGAGPGEVTGAGAGAAGGAAAAGGVGDDPVGAGAVPPAGPGRAAGWPADPAPDALPGRRLGPLVRPAQRRVLKLDSGVTWELLGDLPQYAVDFLLVTYAPGGTSSSSGELMRHPGSEYGCLLSGELVLRLDADEFVLRPGDAISFDSTTPHCYRNDGGQPAVGVWFVLERGR